MNFSHLTSGECTDTGRRRSHNEDSLIRLPTQGLFCVADGMGGMYGGEVASKAVVDGLRRAFETLPAEGAKPGLIERSVIVGHALNQASAWIKRHGEERGASGAGTTVIVLTFDPADPARALAQHAGDSRLYRWRKEKLEQITRDHSVAAAAGLKNEKSLPHMFRGVVTRAVGLERDVKLEETPVDVAVDDLFLVCSDGLTRMVSDRDIARLLEEHAGADPELIAKQLVTAANAAGGEDNISVVAVRVGVAAPAPVAAVEPVALAPEPVAPPVDTPERVSDPAHLSGVTPAHDGDTPTPITAEFQRGDTSRTHERIPIAEAGAEVPRSRIAFAAGALIVALAIIGALLFLREEPATGHDAAPASSHPVPAAVPPEAPAAPAAEPAPALPPPAAPAPAVDPAATTTSPDLESARAGLKVDIRETLLSGRWGALDTQMSALRAQLPELARDLPEWTVYERWTREWKKAEFAAPPANQLYAALRESAQPLWTAAGVTNEPAAPVWTAQAAADADIYCASAHQLARAAGEAVLSLATDRAAEIRRLETSLMPVAGKLLAAVTLTNGPPADSIARWQASVDGLRAWGEKMQGSLLPASPADFVAAAELLAATDAQKDRYFDRLVDLLKAWGYANRGELAAENATPKARETFALYVRIANIRRASPDARSWRARGGEQAVLDFYRAAGETLAERH